MSAGLEGSAGTFSGGGKMPPKMWEAKAGDPITSRNRAEELKWRVRGPWACDEDPGAGASQTFGHSDAAGSLGVGNV